MRETFDSYDTNKTGELYFNSVLDAYYKLTNRSLKISDLYSYLSASKTSDPSKLKISFEQFCALVAEFSSEGCDANTPDGRFSDPLYWTSALLKARHLLRFCIVRPVMNVLGIRDSN